ncbi:hypothetical protein [Glaciecola sp. MF2-115]|uniref:hypothetical protein n=1 Tax=Glaciecola sp. MF2-115 TaxID=3384827 RepID=UPI0039A304D4
MMDKLIIPMLMLFLMSVSPWSMADGDVNQVNLMGSCDSIELGLKLESNLTIFDSMEGVVMFINDKLPHWARVAIRESSKITADRFFKGETDHDSFLFARDFFIKNLQARLIKRANESGSGENDCEMEVASIIEAMSKNKVFNLFNENFHKMLIENPLPLRVASTNNYIEILMLVSLPTIKVGNGVCKTYEQKGANDVVKVTICN